MTDAKKRVADTYNAAADTFDHPALSFWDRFGRRTVERLDLRPGERVLDVCCGSGASALPAAERVAPGGSVVAADLAVRLIDLARAKARRRRLTNIEFRIADMEALGLEEGGFDAVVCVFGVFFVPDMAAAVRELWRHVRPGGRLAITTWGGDLFEPASAVFWDVVRSERPDLHKSFNPWDRISEPASLEALHREAGVATAACVAEEAEHPLPAPEDWWTIVMGSGYRGTIDQMDAATRERVREATLRRLRDARVRSIRASVIYSVAERPLA
jgi:SAM-dependent methyltransferase